MVRAGLGSGWKCAFANDVDPLKVESDNRAGAPQTDVMDAA
jgi:hypothetical protein